MALLRHSLLTLGFLVIIYLVALGSTYLVFPTISAPIGSEVPEETIFATDYRLMVYGRGPIANDGEKVIFVGASDVMESFLPKQVSAALGGKQVHNMATGGSNMTNVAQTVDLILDATPPQARPRLTIFLGIWYGIFTTDHQRFGNGPTQIATEQGRYWVYRPTSDINVFKPVLGPRGMLVIDVMLRPVLLGSFLRSNYIEPAYAAFKEGIMAMLGHVPPPVPHMMKPIDDLDHYQLTDEQKQTLNARQNDKVGPVSVQTDEGFRHLMNIARKTSAAGVRLLVVDMPITTWHAAAMPQFASFQKRKEPWIAALKNYPNVRYVNVQNSVDDSEFSDFIHPRPRFTQVWAQRAAVILRGWSR